MEKMRMETPDLVAGNVEKIGALFPNCITETKDENGKLKKAVNFVVLRQMLSGSVAEGDEVYEFTWVGKKAAMIEANRPIRKTLRPCPKESVDWDNTENLYIEGDNLEVLKLLQESYMSKIKIIYIDPPYNTGHDFVYPDSFIMNNEDYNDGSGYFDEDGNVNYSKENNSGAARYHSDWCSMMYSRLQLSRNLLSDDGVIFLSIGQVENDNLIKICNEVFGEDNKVGIISRMMKSGGNKGQYFSPNIEYILVYAKNIANLGFFREPISDELIEKVYNQVETEGPKKGEKYRIMGLYQAGLGIRPNQRYWIECPDGSFAIPNGRTFPDQKQTGAKVRPQDGDGVWRWSDERFKVELDKGNILFKETNTSSLLNENGIQSKWNIYTKIWLDDRLEDGRVPVDLITKWENRISSQELKDLDIPFDFAKPTGLLSYLIGLVDKNKESYILDFFSGSSSTADAVLRMNSDDNGKRKFIMVQLPEPCIENSDAYKKGFKNICEIGKERIRRAGKAIKEESPLTTQDLDIGFRVFKLDESNMNDVYYSAGEYTQTLLTQLESNVKADRTDLDLLFGCLLEWGLPLSMPYKSEKIDDCTVHTYNDGDLIACFDENVPESVIKEIAKRKPLRAVFRDSSFEDSPAKINVGEIFKLLAPDTRVKVI